MNITKLTPWFALLSGIISSTVCGMLLYAFSVLVNPLSEHFNWSCSEVTLAFAICCAMSCLSCFPAGALADRIGPRIVTIFGGILTGVGFFISAFAESAVYFYITYGVIAGIGSGFLYLPPLTTVPKWWPEKPFFATGFAVVGLGLGSFFMGPLATYIIANFGWRKVFLWCGILMFVMGVFAGLLINTPNKEKKTSNLKSENNKFPHKMTIRTPQFWLLYFVFFCGETSGMTVISQLVPYVTERGFNVMKAAWTVSFFSFANAISRLLSGLIAEKIKLKIYFSATLGIQSIAMLLMYSLGHNFISLCLLVFLIGWGFGTMAVLFPSITIHFFGEYSHSSNYGLLLTACALAGICGPLIGSLSKDISGTYLFAFLIGAALSCLASLVLTIVKSPKISNFRKNN